MGLRIPGTPVILNTLGSYALSYGPTVQGAELSTRWAALGVGVGLSGTWAALDVAGSAALEVAYRRVDVDFGGQALSDQEVPVSVRALASFPASGPFAATGGFGLRLPPGNSNRTKELRVGGPALSAEVLAGVEVRL
jgi:hypothetical protein